MAKTKKIANLPIVFSVFGHTMYYGRRQTLFSVEKLKRFFFTKKYVKDRRII